MDDVLEDCIICNDKDINEIFILECDHNPCIYCTAHAYAIQHCIKLQDIGIFENYYVCQICKNLTELEPDQASYLDHLGNVLQKYHNKRIQMQQSNSKLIPSVSNSNISQQSSQKVPKIRQKQQNQKDFFALMKKNNIQDETINILSNQGISQLMSLHQCTREMLVLSGIKLIQAIKLKKI